MVLNIRDVFYAMGNLLDLAERQASKIEGEWGASRTLDELEAAGELPSEIVEARLWLEHWGG